MILLGGQMAIGRRQFVSALGGAALTWPFAARAQQPAMPVIGFLSSRSPGESRYLVASFQRGLNETGYVEGRNAAVEYRWADGEDNRLPALAADLVHREVAVLVAASLSSALAAKAASTRIPIVFIVPGDPVELGLVASFNRPGGNLTGTIAVPLGLETKRLELLHELVPRSAAIAVIVNPHDPTSHAQLSNIGKAANLFGRQIQVLNASTPHDLDVVFGTLAETKAGAILVGSGAFFNSQRDQIITLAARAAIPAIYHTREFTTAGGLMSYGASIADSYRLVGGYTGRILNGEKPADLPVQQPVKFEFVINLKTAKSLGLTIPPTLLATADEAIE
jgi:putative tryptophan/tyrosine transport system substrate-binding protein